jgi:hypothetical protein
LSEGPFGLINTLSPTTIILLSLLFVATFI